MGHGAGTPALPLLAHSALITSFSQVLNGVSPVWRGPVSPQPGAGPAHCRVMDEEGLIAAALLPSS